MKYQLSLLTAAIFSVALPGAVTLSPAATPPPLSLATTYHESVDLTQFWVSEKLDGARAWWDGEKFLTRGGNTFNAPAWFTEGFPPQVLDGELWIAAGKFQQLMQTIRDTVPDPVAWQSVKYMVFDLPTDNGTFTQRQNKLKQLMANHTSEHLQLVRQQRMGSQSELMARLDDVVERGGEGLILQRAVANYFPGRHSGMIKLKKHQDAEARVLQHLPGKGKFKGMVGSLLVTDAAGLTFKLGSGLTNDERANPPPVGAVVTYRYQGRTRSGKPRFARFLRVRPVE